MINNLSLCFLILFCFDLKFTQLWILVVFVSLLHLLIMTPRTVNRRQRVISDCFSVYYLAILNCFIFGCFPLFIYLFL